MELKKVLILSVAIMGSLLIYNYFNNRKSDETLNSTDKPKNLKDL